MQGKPVDSLDRLVPLRSYTKTLTILPIEAVGLLTGGAAALSERPH